MLIALFPLFVIIIYVLFQLIKERIDEYRFRKNKCAEKKAAEFRAGITELMQKRSYYQNWLQTRDVLDPMEVAHVPIYSYLGEDNLPHYSNPHSPDEDIYTFAYNPSSGVLHRPTCYHATYRRWNIMEILDNPYFHGKVYPCGTCRPVIPDTEWVNDYRAIRQALELFHVQESELHIKRPPAKIHPEESVPYIHGSRRIPLYPADSDLISHIGYDRSGRTLYVCLRTNGKVYTYRNITPMLYDQFIHAESIGRFYNQYIKRHPRDE